ncbi:MAG TPA: glycosyltransferase 87 family protein, partial [Candidatus Acidoferrales bacterium]|nr:glycosyltransferase 87 family protein [Candidatus Acidoferrales bacterium]
FLARTLAPDTLRRDAIVLVGLAAASQPVWLLAVGGNVGGFLLAIAATTAALLIAERPFLGGSAAGWLVVKPHPLLLALPLVLFTLDRRVAARAILGLIAVAAPIVALSLAVRPGWIGEFLVSAGSIGGAGLRRSTVFGLVPNIGLAIAIVAVLVGTFVLWVRSAHPRRAAVISAAVPISLFSAPYGWSYDHILLLVSAAIVIAQVATAHARVRFAFLIALAVVLVPLTWSLYAIAFRRGDEGLSGITPLAMLIVVAAAARVRTTTDTA